MTRSVVRFGAGLRCPERVPEVELGVETPLDHPVVNALQVAAESGAHLRREQDAGAVPRLGQPSHSIPLIDQLNAPGAGQDAAADPVGQRRLRCVRRWPGIAEHLI
jgi:hypothetical protein